MNANLIGSLDIGKSTLLALLVQESQPYCASPGTEKSTLLAILAQESQPYCFHWHRKVNLIGSPGWGKSTLLPLLAQKIQLYWLLWHREVNHNVSPGTGKPILLAVLSQESQPDWVSWRKANLTGYPGTGNSTLFYWLPWHRKVNLMDFLAQESQPRRPNVDCSRLHERQVKVFFGK